MLCTGSLPNGPSPGHGQRRGDAVELLRLDGIKFVVPAQHERDWAVRAFDD